MSAFFFTESAVGQGALSNATWYVNDGKNGKTDLALGEFGPDLGGFVPFARFDDVGPDGHVLARLWDATAAGMSFRDAMLAASTDLQRLNRLIRKFCTGGPSLLPLSSTDAVLEGPPVSRTTWWGLPIVLWPYRIHGGATLVILRDPAAYAPPDPMHLLLVNMPGHASSFGINQSPVDSYFAAPASGWGGPPGTPILAPDERAVDRGDCVVISQENIASSAWIALQRTQESEYFVRNQFLPQQGFTLDPATSRSYLFGGSWGGIVGVMLAMLEPKTFAGSATFTLDDWAYGIGDHRMLTSLHEAAMGMLAPPLVTDPGYAHFYELIDMLGIRFDDPKVTASGRVMQPWDLSIFCLNRRAGDLLVPVEGLMPDEDFGFNAHWSLRNARFNPLFEAQPRKNLEHGGVYGVLPGFNEYTIWNGDEWDLLIARTPPNVANPPLVPDQALPLGLPAYPDPYTHTLRHDHQPVGPEDFLTEVDLAPVTGAIGAVRTLGQGVWPAMNDSMYVGDVDGDPGVEVVFGNLDGHVHILELDPARDPLDPLRLWDEWKSPWLGADLFALSVQGHGSSTRILVGNSRGEIHRIEPVGGSFAVTAQPLVSFRTAPGHLYDGQVAQIYTGDFASGVPGREILVLNRWLDWSLFDRNGAPLPGGRLQRSPHAVGPAHASVADVDGDGDDELLVACQDGHVWLLDPAADGTWPAAKGNPRRFLSFTGQSLRRVEPCYFEPGKSPSHLLLIGRDDKRDDVDPTKSTNIISLYDVATRELLVEGEADAGDPIDVCAFTWIKEPKQGARSALFALGALTSVQSFRLRLTPLGTTKAAIDPAQAQQLVELEDASFRPNQIDSLKCTRIAGKAKLVVALGNGRIFLLDQDLAFARTSDREYLDDPDVTGANPAQPWYSNKTLARNFACDMVQDVAGGDASLYFAEFQQPFLRAPRRSRLGRLEFKSDGTVASDPYVAEAVNAAVSPIKADNNRRLRMFDADGDGNREPHVFAESGDLFFDPLVGRTRQFCDVAYNPPFFAIGDPLQRKLIGGHVFEVEDPAAGTYHLLSGFTIPRDPTIPHADFGGSDWWYPHVGANKLSGQVACYSQGCLPYTLGSVVRAVPLPDPSDIASGSPMHIVIGTGGGYVYAIRPGDPTGAANDVLSRLNYASVDLGMFVVGMDSGNLDDDPESEIAVGTWIDPGGYGDWVDGDLSKNRAHLYLLDPQVEPGAPTSGFGVTALDGDDLCGPGLGIGSGVMGVRVDDVDGDGRAEVWCGDAVGHLWLFRRGASGWSCFFRSADLAAYPGIYNNLFPIKDDAGHTVRLVALSAGYLMAFDVDWARLQGP